MDILFVVPYVPSLVRARSYNLIRHLSARGHRLTVATAWSNAREQEEALALSDLCREVVAVRLPQWRSLLNCARALPGGEPLQSVYSWSPELFTHVLRLQIKADVVHVEHLRGARYGTCARALRPHSAVPIVWDSVDCISYLFQQSVAQRPDRLGRLVNRFELARTQLHEARLWPQFDRVLITSDVDRRALLALDEAAPVNGARSGRREDAILVLPNGVDTRYFAPTQEMRAPRTLVFSGKMSYHANVRAANYLLDEVMPVVWKRAADVRLAIVGKDPPEHLRARAARYGGLVSITGTVPDIRPYLRSATAAIIPLVYGAGSQFKVLEAMACATPVVATPRAVGALATLPGRDLLIGDAPNSLADAVITLLESPERQRALGESGRRYVERHHDWDRIAGHLETIYHEAIRAKGRHLRVPTAVPLVPA